MMYADTHSWACVHVIFCWTLSRWNEDVVDFGNPSWLTEDGWELDLTVGCFFSAGVAPLTLYELQHSQ